MISVDSLHYINIPIYKYSYTECLVRVSSAFGRVTAVRLPAVASHHPNTDEGKTFLLSVVSDHWATGYSGTVPTRLDTAYTTAATAANKIIVTPKKIQLDEMTRTESTLLSAPA